MSLFFSLLFRFRVCPAKTFCGSLQHIFRLRSFANQQEHPHDSHKLRHDCVPHLAVDTFLLFTAALRPVWCHYIRLSRFLRHFVPSGRSSLFSMVPWASAHFIPGEPTSWHGRDGFARFPTSSDCRRLIACWIKCNLPCWCTLRCLASFLFQFLFLF